MHYDRQMVWEFIKVFFTVFAKKLSVSINKNQTTDLTALPRRQVQLWVAGQCRWADLMTSGHCVWNHRIDRIHQRKAAWISTKRLNTEINNLWRTIVLPNINLLLLFWVWNTSPELKQDNFNHYFVNYSFYLALFKPIISRNVKIIDFRMILDYKQETKLVHLFGKSHLCGFVAIVSLQWRNGERWNVVLHNSSRYDLCRGHTRHAL